MTGSVTFAMDLPQTIQFLANIELVLLTPALIFAYYVYLPKVGAKIARGFLGGLFTQSKSEKMTTLSQKGVEARAQIKLEADRKALIVGAIAATDPLKAIATPLIEALLSGAIDGIEGLPRVTRESIKAQLTAGIPAALANTKVNFTSWAMDGIDQNFPQLKLGENLKALGVITSREQIAATNE